MAVQPFYEDTAAGIVLYHGCALAVLPTLPAASFALAVIDPPYHNTKKAEWDKQWKTDAEYLAWIGTVCEGLRRVLKPNGSLYMFASPQMAWGVEGEVRKRLNVLNRIAWRKQDSAGNGAWKKQRPDEWLRTYFPQQEAIIFAEQYGADSLPGFMRECRLRARMSFSSVGLALGCDSRLVDKWETQRGERDACEPTAEQFAAAMRLYGVSQEYEDLRRPFSLSSNVQYTDVWDFDTKKVYKGKHECEKPQALLSHIIAASSRPGDYVLDTFAGTGSTLLAARSLGRKCVGVEIDAAYCERAAERLQQGILQFAEDTPTEV